MEELEERLERFTNTLKACSAKWPLQATSGVLGEEMVLKQEERDRDGVDLLGWENTKSGASLMQVCLAICSCHRVTVIGHRLVSEI